MKGHKRIIRSVVSVLTVFTLLVTSMFTLTASAVVYDFTPSTTMYTTTTSSKYSSITTFGHSTQEVDCSFSYAINVPPNTSYGTIKVSGVLQKKTASGAWINVRTLSSTLTLTNSSSTKYQYLVANENGYADMVKNGQYRVKFTVNSYTGGASIKINPTYSIDFVFG